MNKAKKIIGSVWIGKNILASQKNNPKFPKVKGEIIDETKNTFVIKTQNKIKKLIKKTMIFETDYKENKIQVSGDILQGRMEERMKRKVKK